MVMSAPLAQGTVCLARLWRALFYVDAGAMGMADRGCELATFIRIATRPFTAITIRNYSTLTIS
ncbi:hypothetical protein, partial [Nitrosomonas communis]|uniref:Uncharacterized protein n=1 Tax=Nitrosomonas communis TaxID=44574 RepID=A0A1I4XPW1_9PROT|nr:hypothetical protein SAMN05421863_11672 [Nitrosomonas communis]